MEEEVVARPLRAQNRVTDRRKFLRSQVGAGMPDLGRGSLPSCSVGYPSWWDQSAIRPRRYHARRLDKGHHRSSMQVVTYTSQLLVLPRPELREEQLILLFQGEPLLVLALRFTDSEKDAVELEAIKDALDATLLS